MQGRWGGKSPYRPKTRMVASAPREGLGITFYARASPKEMTFRTRGFQLDVPASGAG